jgi:hypothetical protein
VEFIEAKEVEQHHLTDKEKNQRVADLAQARRWQEIGGKRQREIHTQEKRTGIRADHAEEIG